MTLILILLSLILIIQVVKIAIKCQLINRNIFDFILECMVMLVAFIGIFYKENIEIEKELIITIACIIYETISYTHIYFTYIKNKKLSQLSIKNVIDNSEAGILVLNDGKQILINNTMYKLLKKMNINENYIENIKNQSIENIDGNYVVKIDDKNYLMNIESNQIMAFDITDEYKLKKELDEQNSKVEIINKELIDSINNLEELEKENNLLKLKNKYHDLLGQNLSILHQYLNKDKIEHENFNEIKFMIKQIFSDIENIDDAKTSLANLIKIHKKNGTSIELTGKLPNNEKIASIFFEVIREAVTNAIKHAGSTKICVVIEESMENISMTITNDGKKPKEFITENEGIKGMRRKVEEINGYFYVTTMPEFSVRVEVNSNVSNLN